MSAQEDKIGVGILGAAAIAKKNARGISLARNGVDVVAVGSRTLAKSEAFVKEVEGATGATPYGSYEEVLDDPRVAAVYIPLPTSMHLHWVKAAAAKQKHVLLEKPIALTNEDADAMLKACSDAGVQLMDGTMWMHNPRASLMHSVLDDARAVGLLRSVTTSFFFPGSESFLKGDIRMSKELDGLGCLGDMGWYNIRAALWAYDFELPQYVQACPGYIFTKGDVPLYIAATLVWSEGRRAHIECGFDRAGVQYLEVAGSSGSIRLEDFVIPRTEKVSQFQVRDGKFLEDNATRVAQSAEERTVHLDRPQETLMWEAFGRCIRSIRAGGSPEEHWPKIAALTQRVVLAIEQSARNGGSRVDL
ncbi:g9876 [Coccomyxa elongata]